MQTRWPDPFQPDVIRPTFGGGGRLTSLCLTLEAWRRGLQVTFIDRMLRIYLISDGQTTLTFNDSRPDSLTTKHDYRWVRRKSDAKLRLRKQGIPTPRGTVFSTDEITETDLQRMADDIGYPLVLKPNAGTMGRGVLVNLKTWPELREGYRHLVDQMGEKSLILESHHEGDDHRLLVVGDQVVAATRRIATNVTGDGTHSIAELIAEKNQVRRKNPFLSGGLIKVDFEVRSLLDEQGLTLDTVPASGAHIRLRRMANGSAGADIVDVTDELPDEVKAAAVGAVQAFENIHVAGVDLLYAPGSSGTAGSYVIIELNSRPHIPANMYPSVGTGRDVPRAMLDHFFPSSSRPSSPGYNSLVYDYPTVARAMSTGVAQSVTLAPLPDHDYPARRHAQLAPQEAFFRLTPLQQQRIRAKAITQGIVGDITRLDQGRVGVTVAGADADAVDAFIGSTRRAFRAAQAQATDWDGVITTGFRIDEALKQ